MCNFESKTYIKKYLVYLFIFFKALIKALSIVFFLNLSYIFKMYHRWSSKKRRAKANEQRAVSKNHLTARLDRLLHPFVGITLSVVKKSSKRYET